MDSIDIIERCRVCVFCVTDPLATSILSRRCGHPIHFNYVIGDSKNKWMATCKDHTTMADGGQRPGHVLLICNAAFGCKSRDRGCNDCRVHQRNDGAFPCCDRDSWYCTREHKNVKCIPYEPEDDMHIPTSKFSKKVDEWTLSVPINIERLKHMGMPETMAAQLVWQLVVHSAADVNNKTCFSVKAVINAAKAYPGTFKWLVDNNYLVPVRPTRVGDYYMIPVSFFEREITFHCHGSVAPGYSCSEPGDQSGVYLKLRNIDGT